MIYEEKDVINKIKELDVYINNYENIFLELSLKKRSVPEKFLETYLELIYEKNKKELSLERLTDESKRFFRASG
jgi:hypothetical protein